MLRRILTVLTVAALMAAMLAASAMPAFATHECTKDDREGIQKAETKAQQGPGGPNPNYVSSAVCYNAGGDQDFGPTGIDYGDPGASYRTPAGFVD